MTYRKARLIFLNKKQIMPLPCLMTFKDSPISHLKSSKHFIFYMHTQGLVLSTNNMYCY